MYFSSPAVVETNEKEEIQVAVPKPMTVEAKRVSKNPVLTRFTKLGDEIKFNKLGDETKFRRLGLETRLRRLGDETKVNKLGVETRFNRFGVDTSPPIDEI